MFTGLVEEKGLVRSIDRTGNASDISIAAGKVAEDVALGASIAINGCCLTVVSIENEILTFQAGSETLSRTNLGELEPGVASRQAAKTGVNTRVRTACRNSATSR